MDNVFSDPRVRELQKTFEMKLQGVLPAGKIQLGIVRALRPLTASDKTVTFNLGDKNKVVPGIEMLMPDDRITVVFSQAVGIYVVPAATTGTGASAVKTEDKANGKFISSPHTGVFTAAEIKSLKPFFNATLSFDTDQTKRFDAMSATMFQDVNGQASTEIPYGMKHLFLPSYYPVVGGKVNTLTATMPSESIITDIAGTATSSNYGCMEFGCMYLVGGDKEAILKALFG